MCIKLNRLPLHCLKLGVFSRQILGKFGVNADSIESRRYTARVLLEPRFEFTPTQKTLSLKDPSIAEIVAEKTARKEFFYGIETKPLDEGKAARVDFNMFGSVQPEFISIVWTKAFSESIRETPICDVPNVQLIPHLCSHIPAMPHITIYRLTSKDLDGLLALNLRNVLVIRGDHYDPQQDYHYSSEVVQYLRQAGGAKLGIAVAGYPEGYTNLPPGTQTQEENIKYLKLKVDAGADYIVTQMCYCGEKVVSFLQDARAAGINVPIMIGILIPESYARYKRTEGFSKVSLPPEALAELEQIKHDDDLVRKYFLNKSLHIIRMAMDAGVYGFQLYTLNRFKPVVEIIDEFHRLGWLRKQESEVNQSKTKI